MDEQVTGSLFLFYFNDSQICLNKIFELGNLIKINLNLICQTKKKQNQELIERSLIWGQFKFI